MRSRATARRTPPPEEPTHTAVEPAPTRARGRAAPPATRRARRAAEPEPVVAEPAERAWAPLRPEEHYQREKSRRVSRVDPSVMAEARKQLEEMMTPLGGRKRGQSLAIGAASRRRKPAPKPDEFDLPEYRPGERAGGGSGGDAEDE